MASGTWRWLAAGGGLGAVLGSAATLASISSDNPVNKLKSPAVVQASGPPELSLVPRQVKEPHWTKFGSSTLHQGCKKWDYNWDRRHFDLVSSGDGTEPEVKRRPTAVRHLVLVRHGQYNLDGETDKERTLTNLGIEQALSTGTRLADLNIPWTHMVSSTMSRAIQTAGLIGQNLPENLPVLPNDDILKEGAPYPPEPGSVKKEEVYYQHGAQIEAAFRKYFHRADRDQEADSFELVVCHANVIRYFICRALQLPPEAWLRISLKHASITWISITSDGRCILRSVGEASHIPPEKLSTTQSVRPF